MPAMRPSSSRFRSAASQNASRYARQDLHDIAAFHTSISNHCGFPHYCGESPFLRLPDPPLLGTCGQLLSSVPVDALEATPLKEIPEKLASLLEKAVSCRTLLDRPVALFLNTRTMKQMIRAFLRLVPVHTQWSQVLGVDDLVNTGVFFADG